MGLRLDGPDECLAEVSHRARAVAFEDSGDPVLVVRARGGHRHHGCAVADSLFVLGEVVLVRERLLQAAAFFYAPDDVYRPLDGVPDIAISDEDVRERIRRIDGGENTREATRYRGSPEARYPFGKLPFDQQRALIEQIEAFKREWQFELLGAD